jgi:hypothetical protein
MRDMLAFHTLNEDVQLPTEKVLKIAVVHILSRIAYLASRIPLKFIFEQDGGPLWSPLVILQGKEGENVGHGRFQF